MKKLLGAVRVFVGFVVVTVAMVLCTSPFWPATAFAGPTMLGTILVSDGGTVSNATTGYGSAGCVVGGACAQAFRIPTTSPIFIQAITAVTVVFDKALADAGNGVQLQPGQTVATSTASSPCRIALTPDGGSYVGGCISIAPPAGSSSATLAVFSDSN